MAFNTKYLKYLTFSNTQSFQKPGNLFPYLISCPLYCMFNGSWKRLQGAKRYFLFWWIPLYLRGIVCKGRLNKVYYQ